MESWRIENCVTIVATVALILGLYALSNSWYSLFGFGLMMNVNSPVKKQQT